MPKVPVQKGAIEPNTPKTSKMMKYPEKVMEREKELAELRDGQTCKLHTPKK